MSFYYFVASLPALNLSAPPAMPFATFRAEVERLLPRSVGGALDALVAGRPADSAFARDWADHEVQLRNAVVRARAARRDEDASPFLRPAHGFQLAVEQAVNEAYGKPNPLERELVLDQVRWKVADELSRDSAFGLEAVLAYGLKLKLAERWAGLTDQAGQSALLDAVKEVRTAAEVSTADGRR